MVQPKLWVGARHTPAERQADQAAAKVSRRLVEASPSRTSDHSSPDAQKEDDNETVEHDNEAVTLTGAAASDDDASNRRPLAWGLSHRVHNAMQAGGHRLPLGLSRSLGGLFHADFSETRLHTGTEAAQLSARMGAKAFATGRHIFFGENQYRPDTEAGLHLLVHELAHTVQAGGFANLVRREDGDDADPEDIYDLEDEEQTHDRLDYERAHERNEYWFNRLAIGPVNVFFPATPYETPNGFANQVYELQKKLSSAEVDQRVYEKRLPPDGILGPQTWMMMNIAANQASENPEFATHLANHDIHLYDLPDVASEDEAYQQALWKARSAAGAEIIDAEYTGDWTFSVSSQQVWTHYREHYVLGDEQRVLWDASLFPQGIPEGVTDEDRFAIMARLYEGETLHGRASLFTADRNFAHRFDLERLAKRDARYSDIEQYLYFGETTRVAFEDRVEGLGLGLPRNAKARAVIEEIEQSERGVSAPPTPTSGTEEQGPHIAALGIVIFLPTRTAEQTATVVARYFREQELMEEAMDQAAMEEIQRIGAEVDRLLQGDPDITSTEVLLEFMAGNAISEKQHAQEVETLEQKLNSQLILVLKLGDGAPIPISRPMMEENRALANRNASNPYEFDLIDTPQAAFLGYLPERFTAREWGDGGSETARVSLELDHDSDRGEDAPGVADWAYFNKTQHFPMEPVPVQIRMFNPDAGFFVQRYREIAGTVKVDQRTEWTFGGALPKFNEALWDAQDSGNFWGWVDAVVSIVEAGAVFAAPLIAVAEIPAHAVIVGGRSIAWKVFRTSLLTSLRRFATGEAIGYLLGQISYEIATNDEYSESDRAAWGAIMHTIMAIGVTLLVLRGIRGFKGRGSAEFRRMIAELEEELATDPAVRRAAQEGFEEGSSVSTRSQDLFEQKVQQEFGEPPTGTRPATPDAPGTPPSPTDPRRVRVESVPEHAPEVVQQLPTDTGVRRWLTTNLAPDELAGLVAKHSSDVLERLAASDNVTLFKRLAGALDPSLLRRVLDDLNATQRSVLSDMGSDSAIARLVSSLDSNALKHALNHFSGGTLRFLAQGLSPSQLNGVLHILGRTASGRTMIEHFVDRLSVGKLGELLVFDQSTLRMLAYSPGPERLLRLLDEMPTADVQDTVTVIGVARFRRLLNEIGPELTAEIMRIYTPAEMIASNRWRAGPGRNYRGLTAPQNLARLAIQRSGSATTARAAAGAIPPRRTVQTTPTGFRQFTPEDFKAFFARGAMSSAPPLIDAAVAMVRRATSRAANKLEQAREDFQNTGVLDTSLPPSAQRFVQLASTDDFYHAWYGTALQHLAEAELSAMGATRAPFNMVFRQSEVRAGKTLVPDIQIEMNAGAQRLIMDWTTPGEAGKITKYRGGSPPANWLVEIIHQGPS